MSPLKFENVDVLSWKLVFIMILKKTWTSAGSLAAKYSSLLFMFPSMLTHSNAQIEEKMKEF